MSIETKPMWRIRLAREVPRLLLMCAACAGLAASARYAIAPPRPVAVAHAAPVMASRDPAAEWLAQLFVRRYLTWEADDPEAHQRGLAPFVGSGMEADAGLQPPPSGGEQVQWTEVVQERVPAPGEHVYTVAAQTDTSGSAQTGTSGSAQAGTSGPAQSDNTSSGVQYLSVSVQRGATGALRLAGYPAFVGAPASEPASVGADGAASQSDGRELDEPSLRTVVERALRNYLADAGGELAADLTANARVSLPAQPLSMETVQRLAWSAEGGGALTATVQAQEARGARYTLAYDLDVAQIGGRWEVAAIQMDPDS